MITDKRIIKTRTSIKTAFMELVETNEMNRISISTLASKALVNRSTFYLHYSDVSSVAADIEKEIAETIENCIDDFSIADIYGSTYTIFKRLTKRLDENELMKRYITRSTNSQNVISGIKVIFSEKAKISIIQRFPEIRAQDIEYPLTFAAAGITDCYVHWARSDEPSYTLDGVIAEVSRIMQYIISSITPKIN